VVICAALPSATSPYFQISRGFKKIEAACEYDRHYPDIFLPRDMVSGFPRKIEREAKVIRTS
jgi:hypothetical protein